MANLIETPPLDGESATVTAWKADVDADVAAGDPIAELEGGAETTTVTAPATGRLTHALLDVGEEAPPGTPLAIVTDTDGPTLPERAVTAEVAPDYSGTVTAGSVAWRIDSGEEFGSGTAPSPVDLFLGGLSACLAVSVGVQADIRDVPLSGVSVDASATPVEGTVESIALRVLVDLGEGAGDLEDDVLDRIVAIGERTCHVAELLRDDLPIELTWERV
ncbi:MAG: OsmC family protein [Haloferacaceae archaeon]